MFVCVCVCVSFGGLCILFLSWCGVVGVFVGGCMVVCLLFVFWWCNLLVV